MLSEGQTLHDTYRLVRQIGEGGMGLVFEASHARLSGRYAVKVLHEKLRGNPEALARFDREARVTSSLQHPNIVQVIDFNTASDGTEYLVMELLDGETLAKRLLRQRRLTLDEVVHIVAQIAAALSAAHAQGIVHRDLKPDNVLLVPVDGRDGDLVKVLDFGISKVSGTSISLQGKEGTLFGTPQYMAPEQCEGRVNDVGPAADQFALAAISYELLTGRPPFWGDSLGDILSHILYDEPAPMHVGEGVEAVVRRGLAKSPGARHASITAFAGALRAVAAAPSRDLCTLPTLTFSMSDWSSETSDMTPSATSSGGALDGAADGGADGALGGAFGVRPEEGRRAGRRSSGATLINARRLALAAVLLCVGATLAVGHAQGGPRGWLAGRLSAAAEVAPGPQMARAPQAPARIEPVAPSPSLDRAAPSDPPAAGAPRESDLSAGANLAKVAEAPALAPSLRPVIAAGFPRAAPGRRGLDRPSPATTDRAGQRFEVRRRVSLAPTEPPPLGPGPVESTESRGASAVPESAPFTTEASPGAAPATRRPPAAEDATLPLDEAGGDPDDNRPLGLTE